MKNSESSVSGSGCNPDLNDAQRCILNVMREVAGIFESMEIPYYMQGGTMLGAVRHQGFIPWDDDIDLGVPRKDYERMLQEIPARLPENLELRTYWDQSDHHYYFARIVDKRYKIKRMGSMEVRYENVWIDIFPLDGMPDGKLSRGWHEFRLLAHRAMYHIGCLEKVNIMRPGRSGLEKFIIRTAALLRMHRWFSAPKQLDKVDRLLKKYPLSQSHYIINFMGQTSYRFNELFRKEVYGETVWYPFEDLQLPGPADYDTYLRSLYGDYMTPPAQQDRNAHVSEFVKDSED